jgi:hypothetical protein
VLLATPNLLANDTWAGTEMSALLSRAVGNPQLIVPARSGVDRDRVASRSALHGDIVAVTSFPNIDELATKVYSAIGGAEC